MEKLEWQQRWIKDLTQGFCRMVGENSKFSNISEKIIIFLTSGIEKWEHTGGATLPQYSSSCSPMFDVSSSQKKSIHLGLLFLRILSDD